MEASITLKNVSKHFQKTYLFSNLNLGIEKGTTFAIVGRNGAGKSVLLKLLSTWMTPDAGSVFIRGKEVSQAVNVSRYIAYLPDSDCHDPWQTGWSNIKYRADLIGLDEKYLKDKVLPLIELFNLKEKLNDYPVTYSRGTKRCLDLVLTLMSDTEILLLDEPTIGLDYQNRWALLQYLLKIKEEKTIVIASNTFTEIHSIADRWIVLEKGVVRFDGTIAKMLSQLEIPFTLELMLQTPDEQVAQRLRQLSSVQKVNEYGLMVRGSVRNINDLPDILKQIDLTNIAGINGQTMSVEEFLNQLLSDEGV